MKKIFIIILMTAIIGQLTPITQKVYAAGLYTDVYNSGNIYIFSDLSGTPGVEVYDASNSYSKSIIQMGNSNTAFILFLPNGDMVTYHTDFSINELRCKTSSSNYTLDCSWTGVNGLNLNNTTPENLNMTVVDPSGNRATDTVTSAQSEANPLIGEASVNGLVAPNGDIWLAHYAPSGPTAFGQYVSRLQAPLYDTLTLYDMSFGSCSNAVYLNEQACEDNLETWTDVESANVMDLAIDFFGDIWVSASYSELSVNGSKIYCLDSSESFNSCAGQAFDAYGGIDVGGRPLDIIVDNNDDIVVGIASPNAVKKYVRTESFLNPSSVVPLGLPWRIAEDGLDNIWVHSEIGDESGGDISANVNCYTSSLVSCTTPTLNYQKPGSNIISGIYIDSNNDIWLTSSEGVGSDRLYCFNSDDTPCSTASPFINTGDSTGAYYILIGDLSAYAAQWADNTALLIKKAIDHSGGQGQVNISALVDPIISFNVRNSVDNANISTCELGTVAPGDVAEATCSYRLATSTNATSGYNIYIQAGGPLASGVNNITDIAEGSSVVAGTEGYGIRVVVATSGVASGGTVSEVTNDATYDFSDDDTPIPTNKQTLISSDKPALYTLSDLTSSTLITHALGVSLLTPAGSYIQTVTYTVTGNF